MDQHPDVSVKGSTHLQRNKTERWRLQGLQRVRTVGSAPKPVVAQGFAHKVNVWLINEGQRHVFFGVFLILHVIAAILAWLHYSLKDNLNNARATFGITFVIARSAAVVLHIDVIFILLPVCRNFISVMRRTPIGDVIPFDKNITLHKATAWSIVIGSLVHTLAHVVNLYRLTMADTSAKTLGQRVTFFITANFIIGPLWTGWLMWVALGVMVYYAVEKRRRANNGGFEKFWYTHHLFIPFFILWQLHGMFCMIKPDRPPYCSYKTIGVFWAEPFGFMSASCVNPGAPNQEGKNDDPRRGIHLHQLPRNLVLPMASVYAYQRPQEDYISIHIRVEGDFTTALATAVGCDFEAKKNAGAAATVVNPPISRALPRIMVDGPFGTCSEEFLNYETVLLVGAGIGVTPFASILKAIWYRMNSFGGSKPTRLSKVYFTWVIRDFGTAEWFHSLLHAIEGQDTQNRIEINIYLTANIKEDDMNNIIVHDVGAEKDAITSLRAPTHFGRPNWDRVFASIAEKHSESDVGVFFCGPSGLARTLHQKSNQYSDPAGTRFFFGKENF
ncbi:NADPH oxidase [Mycena sp. CBHHK59/15]|nr:NADPH oxidase [Mycena sp. CBHHK59/15]